MKKTMALILALMLCLFTAATSFAESAEETKNETQDISMEARVTAAKNLADEAGTKASGSGPSAGDLIHFIPTEISVEDYSVTVYGYFVNLNPDKTVGRFTEFSMDTYLDGTLLISGDFGDINDFQIQPYGLVYQSFTFSGDHSLRNGSYVCDDRCYCVTSFRFGSK